MVEVDEPKSEHHKGKHHRAKTAAGGSSASKLVAGLEGLRMISGGIYKHLGKHKDKAFFEKYFANWLEPDEEERKEEAIYAWKIGNGWIFPFLSSFDFLNIFADLILGHFSPGLVLFIYLFFCGILLFNTGINSSVAFVNLAYPRMSLLLN